MAKVKTLEAVVKTELVGYILPASLDNATKKVARAVRVYVKRYTGKVV